MVHKLLQYEVMERLGEGALSTIYAVKDPETKQLFALKHVKRVNPKDIRFVEQMETEFEVSRQFTHPNLRRSYDLKILKTMLLRVHEAFLVMELVEGRPLDARPPQEMLETVDIFIRVAHGLRAMHQMGYAHCDLKPNNILRNERSEVKVIDFGQSCKIGTIKERIQGTPDYIAPEQVQRRPISVQTDIFNLGATLYWAVTKRPIPTLYTVKKKGDNSFLLDAAISTPQDLNPACPPALSNLVTECIATRPQRRPGDMGEVVTRLELVRHILVKQKHPEAVAGLPDVFPDDTHTRPNASPDDSKTPQNVEPT